MVEYSILGSLKAVEGSRSLELGRGKERALLGLLLLRANEPVSSELLIESLWGASPPASAANLVQVYVSRLRKRLPAGSLTTHPAGYVLCVAPGGLDRDRFEQLCDEAARALREDDPGRAAEVCGEALALWRGPPLADFALESFAQDEIRRLDELRLAALEDRAEALLRLGRHAGLVSELESLVSEHPYRERLRAALMLALYRSGRQADALESYREGRRRLSEDLGLEPGSELRELERAILTQDASLQPPHLDRSSGSAISGGVPAMPTPMFGREDDVETLTSLLAQPHVRLVTLIGPGGVGKTRLAIECARRLATVFSDGARFATLAAVADPTDVEAAIQRALAAPLREGEVPAAAVTRYLADRQLLLVIDNFEQVVERAPVMGELVAACPRLTVLATSREPLRVAAERLFSVGPLAVPDTTAAESVEALAGHGAVAMFLDRARARDPDLVLDDATAPHVAEICRRLDGLPLALELAAGRAGLMRPAELAARLDRSLAILVGGARDAPERQRTLRATIEWSHQLLGDSERLVFARLAVFAGGATLAAAEEVTGASLDTLESVVGKQLVARRDDRLVMLETVREYALERLVEQADADVARERLAGWWLTFAREAMPHLVQADRRGWLARLDAEHANALACLRWALDGNRERLALELVGALGEYWWRTNRWQEGEGWISATLESAARASPRARATALLYRARMTLYRRTHRAADDLHKSLELFRAAGDNAGIGACLGSLAYHEGWLGRRESAVALATEAVAFADRSGDADAVAWALAQRAMRYADYDEMTAHAAPAIIALRKATNLHDLIWTCNHIGYAAIAQRRYSAAIDWLNEGLSAARRVGDPRAIYLVRQNQGLAWLWLGDLKAAADALREAIALCREATTEQIIDEPLAALASIKALRGEHALAARLAGAAESLTVVARAPEEATVWSRLQEEFLAPARDRYGPQRWDENKRQGADLSIRDVIDLALDRGRTATKAPTE